MHPMPEISPLHLPDAPTYGAKECSLHGSWAFSLDPVDAGRAEQWFLGDLSEAIHLPTTAEEAGYGALNDKTDMEHLTRVRPYVGAAWYQKRIEVPESWSGKRITLRMERTKKTDVWVDGRHAGTEGTLVAPHVYDLTEPLGPGEHRLTVRVDNTKHPIAQSAHQISDQTQTNWNGILGEIGLRATDRVWIEDAQVYPDVQAKIAEVKIAIGNATGRAISGQLILSAASRNPNRKHQAGPVSVNFQSGAAVSPANLIEVRFELPMGDDVLLWDEFDPALYVLSVELTGKVAGAEARDGRQVSFGMREFRAKGRQFAINGRPTFLRGKHEGLVFPITGYAPTDKESWLRAFRIAKTYGINHYRFHTCTPPKAAFEAADALGIYLQPEVPVWNMIGYGKFSEYDEWCRSEAEHIIREFGNHPSFVMMSMINEAPGGPELVAHLKSLDSRHLYIHGTNSTRDRVVPGDDYWVTKCVLPGEGKFLPIRASSYATDKSLGHVEEQPPSTMADYSAAMEFSTVPLVSHETGQYEVFPDFREIDKYTGVTQARNFEAFRDLMARRGMLDQNQDFHRASGAFTVLCYREEIEACLRTPNFGGFQLLDLQDFPGQGTSLVGILDAFMDSKGLIEPEEWREFCCEVVPLLRMEKYVWTDAETFRGKVQVAHYGRDDLKAAVVEWLVKDESGQEVARGALPKMNIRQGNVRDIGDMSFSLQSLSFPQKLTIEITIRGTSYRNHYPLWVFPARIEVSSPHNVVIRRPYDEKTREILSNGGTVLLLPELPSLHGIYRDPTSKKRGPFKPDPKFMADPFEGMFIPVFWNFTMFPTLAAGTDGFLCDPSHPALADFPTEFHCNWQWWHLIKHARPVILDDMPADYRPIVQPIDTFCRSHKLGLIFETKAGAGKLLVCAIDLPAIKDRPEARQMMRSLIRYAGSEDFAPRSDLGQETLTQLVCAQPESARRGMQIAVNEFASGQDTKVEEWFA